MLAVLAVLLVSRFAVGVAPPERRMTRLFEVEPGRSKVVGPAPHVPSALGLKLASVTLDQPEYWPNEAVYLKILMPGLPKSTVTVEWSKRDGTPTRLPTVTLDEGGVAVVPLMNGEKRPLELGEYRASAWSGDGGLQGQATFTVVEGALGALSFAHEFQKVTSIDALEASKGGWFLGNASGAGKRWGNGLSFKNELRLDNRPYTGSVELASRCMLSGCNGVDAGPRQTVQVQNGLIEATLDVGGHSGPFQIEVIAGGGSLRYQFEGSSHVERDMVSVALGVGWQHRAGLAPYEGTTPVPGRSIYVERGDAVPTDPFEVASVIATNGVLEVKARRALSGAAVIVWTPTGTGTFAPKRLDVTALSAGQTVAVPIEPPFSLVTVGGFDKKTFVEGFAVAFTPSGLQLALAAPDAQGPLSAMTVSVTTKDSRGHAVPMSGILEVFDNRVASRSPITALTLSIGDSVRQVSNYLTAWVDPIEAARQQEAYEKDGRGGEMAEDAPALRVAPIVLPAPPAPPPGMPSRRMTNRSSPPGALTVLADASDEGELVRKGERKVVACTRVRTGVDGRASVEVVLPPQTGRVSVRFVAVSGFDHAAVQESVDVTKRAFVDAKAPSVFVPGAALSLRLPVTNGTDDAATVEITGPGIDGAVRESVAPGQHDLVVPWTGDSAGVLAVVMTGKGGKVLDRRELSVRDLARQPVTWSRLELGGAPFTLKAGEAAVAFASPGQLLRGIVMNMVTTMYSWFGHAEAVSAGIAVRATLLVAIRKGILDGEGLDQTLAVDLAKGARDLEEVFFDALTGLVRPWPGLPPSPLWSAWVARNLHSAARALASDAGAAKAFAEPRGRCERIATAIDRSLGQQKAGPLELGGYDPSTGEGTVPVEVDGETVWRAVTDDAVLRFIGDRLLPLLDPAEKTGELAFARAFDTFRFLRAFERTGRLQYLTETAIGLWRASRRAEFERLYPVITRGMILAQEPGMIQGPALLGGVYSSPMALVRFLELLLLTETGGVAKGTVAVSDGPALAFGERFVAKGATTLTAPAGAVIRVDTPGEVVLTDLPKPPFANVSLSGTRLGVGEEGRLTIELDGDKDPLEYVAIVAVPTTTSIKQTEDILSDYKGQLVYGQQGTGASKLQVLSVPFRGLRTMTLWIEGLYPGRSPGFVAVRHLSSPSDACTVAIPAVTVESR